MSGSYQRAYAQTVATITARLQELQGTLLTLQKTVSVPKHLWAQLYPTQLFRWTAKAADNELYVESQLRLNYLIDLVLYVARDQINALPDELDTFFNKRDLYWWKSALSLIGASPYLERELIAPEYYVLAQQAQAVVNHRHPNVPNT